MDPHQQAKFQAKAEAQRSVMAEFTSPGMLGKGTPTQPVAARLQQATQALAATGAALQDARQQYQEVSKQVSLNEDRFAQAVAQVEKLVQEIRSGDSEQSDTYYNPG